MRDDMCVRLYLQDIEQIAALLNLAKLEFVKVYCIVVKDNFHFTDCSIVMPKIELKKKAKGACVLLEKDKCRIYPKRPLLCRSGPFTLGFMRSRKYFGLFKSYCKGIGKGEMHSSKEIEEMLKEEENIEKKYKNDLCNNNFLKSIFNAPHVLKREIKIALTFKDFLRSED